MSVRRDYKPDSTWNSRRRVRRHGALVLALVLIGLVGALVAYIGDDPQPRTRAASSAPPKGQPAQDTREVRRSQPDAIPPPPKPKYEFYTVLPQRQVEIPKDEINAPAPIPKAPQEPPLQSKSATPTKPAIAPAPTRQAKATSGYMVQAGSFSSYADADRIKASLALLGIRARIESGTGTNNATVHRVRIGPLRDPNEVQALRQRLQEANIQSIAIRID